MTRGTMYKYSYVGAKLDLRYAPDYTDGHLLHMANEAARNRYRNRARRRFVF